MVRRVVARSRLVRLHFARPIRTAQGEFTGRESVLLELRDADGVAGFGEAAPWPGFGTGTAGEALAALTGAESLLCEEALLTGAWPAGLDTQLGLASPARAAVEGALWDLAARRAGQPLADVLAARVGALHRVGRGAVQPAVLRHVPTSALLVARDAEALREEAARVRASGHSAAKLKLGAATLADDVARARAAREGLGAAIRLRGDANGAWDLSTARAALAALADFDFDYVEQPLAADDFEGLAQLHRDAPTRLAADESVATEAGARRLLAAAAVDVVVLKPATLGGPARALEVAVAARQAGVEVVFSHTFESAVGARHALHCAAAWGDPSAVHGLCTAGLFVSDVAEPVACRGGRAELSSAPGLGITP